MINESKQFNAEFWIPEKISMSKMLDLNKRLCMDILMQNKSSEV